MKEKLGEAIYNIRVNKGMKQKDLSKKISIGQISNIETGSQMPSAEKFIDLLVYLNVGYDEFIYLMDDDYLTKKVMMEKQLAEFVRRQNIGGLTKLAEEASTLFVKYGDIYFEHLELMTHAMAELIATNNNYESAKGYLLPIKKYLKNIKVWGDYELTLISRCLFMFQVEEAICFGEQALEMIKKNNFNEDGNKIACVLLNNLATFTLDYKAYYVLSLNYSQASIKLAEKNNDATKVLHAKIIYQIACFKLKKENFCEEKLLALLKALELLEWQNDYIRLEKFIQKYGILLSNEHCAKYN